MQIGKNSSFNFNNLIKFFQDQMGVFGPISFLILILGLVFILPKTDKDSAQKDRWFLCFILPALIIIAGQAFVSRAHANWAASAYPAASVLVAAWILRSNWTGLMKTGIVLNIAIGLLMMAMAISPSFADKIGASNSIKRARGWETSVEELQKAANSINAQGIVFDEREFWHGMDYYGEELAQSPPPHYLWQRHNTPHAFAESYAPIPRNTDNVLLIASLRPNFIARMREDFGTLKAIGRIDVPIGGKHTRHFCLYRATQYAPVDRTREYEIRMRDIREDCPFEKNLINIP